MKQTVPMQLTERRQSNWLKWALLGGIIILIAAAGWLAVTWYQGGAGFGKQGLSPAEFEEATGLRVTLIAVTAGGGMVDARIKVLDPEKASQLLANPKNRPILIAEDGKTELSPPSEMDFDVDLEAGKAYFTLYGNPNQVIKRGSFVTVVIGDYRLEPVLVQ